MSKEKHKHKYPAASLMENQEPATRVYVDNYATPEMKSELRRLQFEAASTKSGPEAEMAAAKPSAETGANSWAPMGSSYPVALHVLLDADPAVRAYWELQPKEIQQEVLAVNLQTAEELEHFIKKLENRLEGRPDTKHPRN